MRYHAIADPDDATCAWVFDEPDSQTKSNPKLQRPFKDWLTSGEGIFHISGKPGSGKSTLMKYIWISDQTRRALQGWAGTDSVVAARFFFWKPGSPLQRSHLGLVRSILYQVLSQCPDAIQRAFPQYWDPSEYQLWSPLPQISVENKAIRDGFDNLLHAVAAHTFGPRRLVFFIDGLDEFEDDRLSYQDLVTSLENWVALSRSLIKVCVSSRELPTFQGRLAAEQRLRLQDLNLSAIEALIQQRLEANRHFRLLQDGDATNASTFMLELAVKADGVFLWVVLTLKMVSEALECGESLSNMMKYVDSLPEELEEFFIFILESIPKALRRKAYFILAYALASCALDGRKTRERGSDHRSSYLSKESLFRWSFLDDYMENPSFAEHLPTRYMEQREITDRIDRAEVQIQGLSKGLLEIIKPEPKSWLSGHHGAFALFTHRSIPEFLEECFKEEPRRDYIRDFDPVGSNLSTLLAAVKSVDVSYFSTLRDVNNELAPVFLYVRKHEMEDPRHFLVMALLDSAIGDPYRAAFPDQFATKRGCSHEAILSIPLFQACVECCYRYPLWKIRAQPSILADPDVVCVLLRSIIAGCLSRQQADFKFADCELENLTALLDAIFNSGNITLNQVIQLFSLGINLYPNEAPIWVYLLASLVFKGPDLNYLVIMEAMASRGAASAVYTFPNWHTGREFTITTGDNAYCISWSRDRDPGIFPRLYELIWPRDPSAGSTGKPESIIRATRTAYQVTLEDMLDIHNVDELRPGFKARIMRLLNGDKGGDYECGHIEGPEAEVPGSTSSKKIGDDAEGNGGAPNIPPSEGAGYPLMDVLPSRTLPWAFAGMFCLPNPSDMTRTNNT